MAIWLVQGFVLRQHPQPLFTYCVIGFGEAFNFPSVSVGWVADVQSTQS